MAVRSKRLAGPVVCAANASTAVYTCPAGVRALVKSLHVFNVAGSGNAFKLQVDVDDDNHVVVGESIASQRSLVMGPAALFLVLDAGQVLRARVGGAGVAVVTVSGAELVL